MLVLVGLGVCGVFAVAVLWDSIFPAMHPSPTLAHPAGAEAAAAVARADFSLTKADVVVVWVNQSETWYVEDHHRHVIDARREYFSRPAAGNGSAPSSSPPLKELDARRAAFEEATFLNRDFDQLLFCVRSVLRNARFLGRIFLVVPDGHTPTWLKTHHVPTFGLNSAVAEGWHDRVKVVFFNELIPLDVTLALPLYGAEWDVVGLHAGALKALHNITERFVMVRPECMLMKPVDLKAVTGVLPVTTATRRKLRETRLSAALRERALRVVDAMTTSSSTTPSSASTSLPVSVSGDLCLLSVTATELSSLASELLPALKASFEDPSSRPPGAAAAAAAPGLDPGTRHFPYFHSGFSLAPVYLSRGVKATGELQTRPDTELISVREVRFGRGETYSSLSRVIPETALFARISLPREGPVAFPAEWAAPYLEHLTALFPKPSAAEDNPAGHVLAIEREACMSEVVRHAPKHDGDRVTVDEYFAAVQGELDDVPVIVTAGARAKELASPRRLARKFDRALALEGDPRASASRLSSLLGEEKRPVMVWIGAPAPGWAVLLTAALSQVTSSDVALFIDLSEAKEVIDQVPALACALRKSGVRVAIRPNGVVVVAAAPSRIKTPTKRGEAIINTKG